MMKHVFLWCLLSLLAAQTFAQVNYYDRVTTTPELWEIPKLSVKYLPSHLIGEFPSYLFEVEGRINKGSSIVARFGVVSDIGSQSEVEQKYFQNMGGIKSSIAYKVALKTNSEVRPFYAIELFYNDVGFGRTRTFELGCGPGCQYFQEASYDVFFTEVGLRFVSGVNIQISEVLFFEASLGLGIKQQDIASGEGRPLDPIIVYGEPYEDINTATNVAVDFSIKLGFVIFK